MAVDGNAPSTSSRQLAAAAWAASWEQIDRQLSPLGLEAMEALGSVRDRVVLDVGCGAGQTLLQLAERVGRTGQVVGVDIAPLLLAVARRRVSRLAHVRVVEADAQVLNWPDGSVDAIYSRFGVMAFQNPAAAFANFRRILRPFGKLAFCCWRSLDENELDSFPLKAARLDVAVDETPFSLSDPRDVQDLLEGAGFDEIVIRPFDVPVSSGDLEAMTSVLLSVGTLGKIVRENPDLRQSAELRLRQALTARQSPDRVELRASVWVVSAKGRERSDQVEPAPTTGPSAGSR